jgi:hypothetical protein
LKHLKHVLTQVIEKKLNKKKLSKRIEKTASFWKEFFRLCPAGHCLLPNGPNFVFREENEKKTFGEQKKSRASVPTKMKKRTQLKKRKLLELFKQTYKRCKSTKTVQNTGTKKIKLNFLLKKLLICPFCFFSSENQSQIFLLGFWTKQS